MKLQLGNENTRGNPWPHDNYLPSKPRTNGEFSCDCPDGHVQCKDYFTYTKGEYITTSLRRALIPIAAHQNRSLFKRVSRVESAYISNIKTMKKFNDAVKSEDGPLAIKLYNSLPKSLQDEKNIIHKRMQAASFIADNDKEYMKAISNYVAVFPDDPAIDLILIDYYFLKEDFDKAQQSVQKLNDSLGGDGYLLLLSSMTFLEQGKIDEAEKACLKGLAIEEDLIELHWGLISVYLEKKDNQKILSSLKVMDQVFVDMESDDFKTIPGYQEFSKSEEHNQWLAYLKSK